MKGNAMEWLCNELWSVLKPHISKCIDKIKIRRKLKKITRKLCNQILSEFQNEAYYNEFDKYLSVNKVISNFIQNSITYGAHGSEDIDSFINKRIDHFVVEYPRFLVHKSSIVGMLKRLFVLIFNEINTIENEELKHVVCILKEQSLAIEKSISELSEKIDDLGRKNDSNTQAILDYMHRNIEGIDANVEFVSSVISVPFVPAEINKQKLCARQTAISNIIEDSNVMDWLHVSGSAWSGKTTTASLIVQKLTKTLWIDFSYGEPINTIKAFEYCFKNILSSEESYTIIIDNLPEIHTGDVFLNVFCGLICNIKKHGHKIISFGTGAISNYILSHISEQYGININSVPLPDFSVDDVVELMELFKAPHYLMSDRTSEFFLALSGKKPAAIKIMLHYLKSSNWDINSDQFLNIFSLDIDELTHEIKNVVNTSIKDEKTRELLYRISLVGHEINCHELEIIANVEPAINLVGERLDSLKEVWVTGDNFIKANGLLRSISSSNLNSTTKIAIHDKMADSILSKRVLDQIDISNVICHLMASKRVNEAGRIYILAMQSLCESNIEYNDSFLFAKMWHTMPLPNDMDDSIKATIRLLQIIYFTQCGENCNYFANGLIELSKRNEKLHELLIAGGALLMQKNHGIAMKLINASNEQGIPSQFDLIKETGLNPLESIIKLTFMTAKELDDISTWFTLVKSNLTNDAIRVLEKSDDANLFRHGFERARLGIIPSKVNDFLLLIEEIFDYALSCSWIYLASGCATTLIRLASENQHNYDKAKVLYEKYCAQNDNHIFVANAKYCMGLLAVDHKDYSFALKCLCDASSSREGLDDLDKVFCCANCYIAFSKSSMLSEAKAAINQALALTITAKNIESELHEELLFKIHFERLICLYLSKDFGDSLDSLEYINNYLINNPIEGNEHFISITCHCLTYIHGDLLRHDPPKQLGDEEYTVPYCGIMLNQSNTEEFKKQINKPKVSMINIVSAQLLDHFGKDDRCYDYLLHGWGEYSSDTQFSSLSLQVFFSGYGLYKLLEKKEYTLACKVLSNILNHYSQEAISNSTLIDHSIIRLTFFIIGRLDIAEEFLEELKKTSIPLCLKERWNAWLEIIELSIQKNNARQLVSKGHEYHQKNDSLLQAVCYIGATVEADFKDLLNLYLIVLSSSGDISGDTMMKDLYWLNYVLIPMMKEQLLHAFIETGINNSALTQMLSNKNEYCFDTHFVKKILKDSVTIWGSNYFKQECVLWLDN